MSDGQDGSEGRADLHDLVPKRTSEPDDHLHEKQSWSEPCHVLGSASMDPLHQPAETLAGRRGLDVS
jgi:hypothetical protein